MYKAVKQGQDMIVRTFKQSSYMSPYQGATVTNYIKSFFSPFSPSGNARLRDMPEFNLFANMYDRYRIDSVSIRIIPRVNVNTAAVTASSSYNNSNAVYYVTMDRDSVAPSSIVQLKRYKSTRVLSQLKGCRTTYSVKWPKGFWLDTTSDREPTQNNPIANSIGLIGGITVYGENFTERAGSVSNYIWADCEVSYRVAFQTYNPQSLSLDEVGNVSIAKGSDDDDSQKPITPLGLADLVEQIDIGAGPTE